MRGFAHASICERKERQVNKKDKIFNWIETIIILVVMMVLWVSMGGLYYLDIPSKAVIIVLYLAGTFSPFGAPAIKMEGPKEE